MRTARIPTVPALCLFAVLIPGQVWGQIPEAEALVKRLEDRYNTATALRADFTQTMSSAYSDIQESFSGTLVLQGSRYRVETGRQTLVTDGAMTWIYNADENQVLVNRNEDGVEDFSVDKLFSDYSERFIVRSIEAENLGGRAHHVLQLEPRDPDSFFENVTVWMRADDAVISRIRVVDQNETTMLFDLTNVDFEPTVDESTFTFTPPAGAEVIDLRS